MNYGGRLDGFWRMLGEVVDRLRGCLMGGRSTCYSCERISPIARFVRDDSSG